MTAENLAPSHGRTNLSCRHADTDLKTAERHVKFKVKPSGN